MLKEFDIAVKRNLIVLPIGATGYISADLWRKVWKERKKYLGNNTKIHNLFKKINDSKKSPAEIIKIFINLINLIQKGI